MPLVVHLAAAGRSLVELAPVVRALAGRAEQRLVDAGPHRAGAQDPSLAELGLPRPDARLPPHAGTVAERSTALLSGLERTVAGLPRPDFVVVTGDADPALAAALEGIRGRLRLARLAAGLRSGERGAPEELSRVAVDHLADLLLTPSADADANLRREGIAPDRVVRVGSVHVDSALAALPRARERAVAAQMGLCDGGYAVATLHRPGTVEDPAALRRVLEALARLSRALPVVLPADPRARERLAACGAAVGGDVRVTAPFGFVDRLSLVAGARLVLTDSGSLQEETTALGIPCLTLRDATERPITVTEGTNQLVGTDPDRILAGAARILASTPGGGCPALWDGRAGERVAEALLARC